jgi:spore maturation protein SpmA
MPVVMLLGVLGVASMSVYLLAVRCASWDLIPVTAMARVRWWHRHAPTVLVGSALVSVACGCVLAFAR